MLCGSQFSPSGRAGKKAAGKVLSGRLFEHRDVSAVRVRPRLAGWLFHGVSRDAGARGDERGRRSAPFPRAARKAASKLSSAKRIQRHGLHFLAVSIVETLIDPSQRGT